MKMTQFFKSIVKDESGQGATEYILLLVIVVAVAFLFKGKIMATLGKKLDSLDGEISGFTSGGGQ